jgi:hypothetical protein
MRECNSGIWFKEEDPTDEAYDPKCCTNVYFDYAVGKFDYIIIDCDFKYIEIKDDLKEIFDEYDEYLYCDEYGYDADTEVSS